MKSIIKNQVFLHGNIIFMTIIHISHEFILCKATNIYIIYFKNKLTIYLTIQTFFMKFSKE